MREWEQTQINSDGRFFLAHAHTLHGEPLRYGVDLNLYPDGTGAREYDDLTNPIVDVRCKLGMAERMRQYGIECLGNRADWSGRQGPQGHPIPTDTYIARVSNAYGNHHETRTITASRYRREGQAGALNHAGRDLRELLDHGFEIVASSRTQVSV